jgi:hypothetical protein
MFRYYVYGLCEENEVQNIFNDSTMVVFPHLHQFRSVATGSYGKAVVMPDLEILSLLVKKRI